MILYLAFVSGIVSTISIINTAKFINRSSRSRLFL